MRAKKPHSEERVIRWDEKAGLRGMRYAPNVRRAQGTKKRRPTMKKTRSYCTTLRKTIMKQAI
jgi:hypothetical protein